MSAKREANLALGAGWVRGQGKAEGLVWVVAEADLGTQPLGPGRHPTYAVYHEE